MQSSVPPRPRDFLALGVLVLGALAAVLAVLPYRAFDLDRFFGPKELALHLSALFAGVILLSGARRISLTRADLALGAWVALSAVSAVFASNHWLALRAFAITLSGAVIFWSARRMARAGLGGVLARWMAAAVVLGALTALAQAYGLKMEFAALNRAPGGTFGNRNFMAHLTAMGLAPLIACICAARSARSAGFWTVALAASVAALVLSRTRAAWLALIVAAVVCVLIVVRGPALLESIGARRRLTGAAIATVIGVLVALALPNALDWKSDNPYLESVVGVVNYREGSGRGRLLQYSNSARMTLAHPVLGVGPGNWPAAYPGFAPATDPSISETTGMAANPWPSSDWVAAASERGILAIVALGATFLMLIGGAIAARYDSTTTPTVRLYALAGAVALGVAAIEGLFDAVLLLPTPALLVWALAGALLPPRKERWVVEFGFMKRTLATAMLGAALLAISYSAAGRVEAMRLATIGTATALEEAVRNEPGSYRIRMKLAEVYAGRGQCAKAREHVTAARKLFPLAPAARRLAEQCK